MNILSIASVLPVPDIYQENDIIFTFYEHYIKSYKEDKVYFIRPSSFSLFRGLLSKRWRERNKISRLKRYNYKTFEVNIFPYFSISRFVNLHALLSTSIFLFNRRKLKEIIIQENIQVIHAQFIFPDGLLAYYSYKKYKIPYILTIRSEQKYFFKKWSNPIAKKIITHANTVTTPSGPMYKLLKSNNLTSYLIPHGLSDKFFVRKDIKEEENKVKLITIGQLIQRKMINNLIEAIAPLVEKYQLSLTIVGEGPEKKKLMNLIKALKVNDNIVFRGELPHNTIPAILKEHDIFILPSSSDTFGRVYFEAMAAGLPIILSKNTGVFGFIKENESALCINPYDIRDIREKVEFLILNRDIRKKLAKNGKKIVEKFKWNKICKEFHERYEEIVKCPAR